MQIISHRFIKKLVTICQGPSPNQLVWDDGNDVVLARYSNHLVETNSIWGMRESRGSTIVQGSMGADLGWIGLQQGLQTVCIVER